MYTTTNDIFCGYVRAFVGDNSSAAGKILLKNRANWKLSRSRVLLDRTSDAMITPCARDRVYRTGPYRVTYVDEDLHNRFDNYNKDEKRITRRYDRGATWTSSDFVFPTTSGIVRRRVRRVVTNVRRTIIATAPWSCAPYGIRNENDACGGVVKFCQNLYARSHGR